MQMKRRSKVIICLAVLFVLLAAAYCVFASFNGSIIKKAAMTSRARAYVSQKFPDMPLKVEFSGYDFKICGYYCNVRSESSEDTHFIVYEDSDGSLTDDYGSRVVQGENTLSRLIAELDDYTEKLMGEIFPHRTSLVMCDYCEDSAVSGERPELDIPFNAGEFPAPVTLTVWAETAGEEPTWEELAERLRELERLIRDRLPCIERYSVSIQARYIEEDGELRPSDYSSQVCAFDVPRDIITSDALDGYLKEVRAAHEAELDAIAKGQTPGKD